MCDPALSETCFTDHSNFLMRATFQPKDGDGAHDTAAECKFLPFRGQFWSHSHEPLWQLVNLTKVRVRVEAVKANTEKGETSTSFEFL